MTGKSIIPSDLLNDLGWMGVPAPIPFPEIIKTKIYGDGQSPQIFVEKFNILPSLFISQWDTTKSGNHLQITLPLHSAGAYDFMVYWGDGEKDHITEYNDSARTHNYSHEGTYMVSISGTITGWRFNNGGDKLKILDISSWGPLNLGNAQGYFLGCTNLTITATDLLDLSETTILGSAFRGCSSLTTIPRMGEWSVSAITNMSSMFSFATLFNQDISGWDVSNVTTMKDMFWLATAFNQDIGGWNVGLVENMQGMFQGDTAFDPNISAWDVSNVTSMSTMFQDVTLSTSNYDSLLIGWAAQGVQDNVIFNAGYSKYTAGGAAEAARTHLIGVHIWDISDGGPV